MLYEILICIIALLFIWFLMFLAYLLAVLDFKKFFLNSDFLINNDFFFFKSKKNIFYWCRLYKKFRYFNYSSSVDNFVLDCCNKRGNL